MNRQGNKKTAMNNPCDYRQKSRMELLKELEAANNRVESLSRLVSRCKEASMDQRRLATVIHDSYDAVTVQDPDGTITSWSRGAEQMYGYSHTEAIGMNISTIIPNDKRQEQQKLMQTLREGRSIPPYETRRVTRDKRTLDVWLTQTVLKDEGGNLAAIATTERNITNQKLQEKENARLLDELARSNQKLKKLNHFKDKVMAMVAHDLRNPLFAISGFTRFLLDRKKNANLGKTQQAMIQRIHNAGEYMARLINQMMDFSKIEHGKLVLEMEQNDITVLVKERIELSEMAARNKDIQFRANLEEVPRFFFDNTRIEQVVDNLISNAIKYSPAGSVIDLSLSADDDQVEFSVKDEGPGISREDQKLLFGEFQTLSAKPTGGEECLGLGLNIVKGLVSLHGGEVAVDSELGKGARFFVWLPLRPSPAVLARAEGRSQKAPLPHSTH